MKHASAMRGNTCSGLANLHKSKSLTEAERDRARIALVQRLMGGKTVFARSASERKDLDCLQVLIDMPEAFWPPLGLQVDVAVEVNG